MCSDNNRKRVATLELAQLNFIELGFIPVTSKLLGAMVSMLLLIIDFIMPSFFEFCAIFETLLLSFDKIELMDWYGFLNISLLYIEIILFVHIYDV